ncbi:Replication protein A 70 kDa DNA-binding subunit B [Linum perenne]
MSLQSLSPENLPPYLHLRLLHAWRLGTPLSPDQYFAYGTLWMDSEGVLIQGDSHRNFESNLQKRVAVGSVYKLSGYSLRTPRANFRTSKFPHWLELTAAAQFELQPPTDPPFPLTTFDFIPFSRLNSRMPPCPYLTAVGEPNHVEPNSVVAPVQKVTIIDASGLEVVVSLWSEFSTILDAASIVLDDKTNPFIVALGSFRIGTFGGDTTAGSCPASRIAVRPDHPAVNALRNVYDCCLIWFTITPRPVAYIPPKFHTPEKLKQHVQDSFRTLQELEAMYVAGSDPEPRYRCVATIIGCDRHQQDDLVSQQLQYDIAHEAESYTQTRASLNNCQATAHDAILRSL